MSRQEQIIRAAIRELLRRGRIVRDGRDHNGHQQYKVVKPA